MWAKGGDRPTIRLTADPPDMTLTPDGRIEWPVPKGFAEPFVVVTISATGRTS